MSLSQLRKNPIFFRFSIFEFPGFFLVQVQDLNEDSVVRWNPHLEVLNLSRAPSFEIYTESTAPPLPRFSLCRQIRFPVFSFKQRIRAQHLTVHTNFEKLKNFSKSEKNEGNRGPLSLALALKERHSMIENGWTSGLRTRK
jgi:hypothetical protein